MILTWKTDFPGQTFPLQSFDSPTPLRICKLVCYNMYILCCVKRNSLASVTPHEQWHCTLVKIIKLDIFTCRISTTTMRVTGSLEGMCFELRPGNFYLNQSFFEFLGVCICVDEIPVLCLMTPSQWVIGCRTFEEQWTFRSLKMRPLCYIVYVMPLKDCRATESWKSTLACAWVTLFWSDI